MTIIQRELQRGFEITEKIMTGKRPWSDLFTKHTFFTSGYKYYISVIATSKTQEAHNIWSGYVESKVRMLVQKLEQHPSIALAHAFNKGYERRHRCKTSEEILQVQEGSMEFLVSRDTPSLNGANNNASGSDRVKKEEPVIKKEEDDTEEDGVSSTIPKAETADVNPEDKMSVKEENEPINSNVTAPPQTMDIFTTTHYIGLELASSKCFPIVVPSCLAIHLTRSFSRLVPTCLARLG